MSTVHLDWIIQADMPTEAMAVALAAVREAPTKLVDQPPETSEELTVLCRAISTLLALLDEQSFRKKLGTRLFWAASRQSAKLVASRVTPIDHLPPGFAAGWPAA